jgi:hypothetical protein
MADITETQLNNAVALLGVIASDVQEIDNINSLQYNGWAMFVETVRHSGVPDYAVVVMPQGTNVEDLDAGIPVMIIGKMQTFKDYATAKCWLYILADICRKSTGRALEEQNERTVNGNDWQGHYL